MVGVLLDVVGVLLGVAEEEEDVAAEGGKHHFLLLTSWMQNWMHIRFA